LEYLQSAAVNDRTLLEDAARSGYDYLLEKRGEEAARAWWDKVLMREEEAA
jgi:hypothetical protein